MATPNKEGKNFKPNKETMEERKQIAEMEDADLDKEVKQLLAWIDMIESMDMSELKQYVKNRPKGLKMTKRDKNGIGERSRSRSMVKNEKKSKNNGIMASVWKFHKEDDDNTC